MLSPEKNVSRCTVPACSTIPCAAYPSRSGPLSFYQVNTKGANRPYGVAADFAAPGPEDTLLDLYCGAGTIGLSMAEHCGRLIGVEIVPEAVESARRNAAAMGVEHAECFCADAGTAAQKLAADGLLPISSFWTLPRAVMS